MKIYIALLRGINVGGANTVSMKELKACFEKLGYAHVETYINSGNVLFTTQENSLELLTKTIERALHATFGFPIRVLVKPAEVLERIVEKIPPSWTNDAEQKTDILFLWKNYASLDSLKLLTLTPNVDEVEYIEEAIVWHSIRSDYKHSGMHAFIGTQLYKHMTTRNVNTVRKLVIKITQLRTQAGSTELPAV